MSRDPIATRYAQAIFEAAKDDNQVDETVAHLRLIQQAIHTNPDVRQFLLNPDVDPDVKVDVLDRAVQGAWPRLVRSLLFVVLSFGRAEFLEQIVEAFEGMVDEAQGRLRVLLRSAYPLPEAVLHRLRTGLEQRVHQHVLLTTEVAPALLGGLQIFLDHQVIDGSVHYQLDALRQRLKSVRVH
jgi:F-type H+-transporting ATPase subunit delta